MKIHYTPQNNTFLVALISAAFLFISSIPAVAAVESGAVRNSAGVTPVVIAPTAHDSNATVHAIAKPPTKPVAKPDPKALHAASLRGDLAMVQRLVRDRVNIHYANSDRETALHMAASRGHLSIVIFLINNGGNMNARTRGNWIPLHHAVRFNRQKVANYLMAKGAPVLYKTSDGVNSMDIALAMGNQRMINLVSHYMYK